MKFPNAYFGNGPGQGEDLQSQRDQEAYQRNRLQMTVATSSFAGVALVGMFCSCLWFICCRNSSSKTRKKARTNWASAEAGLQNPYSYDGYLESQNSYMQMTTNGADSGVAPYLHNPLYHPTTLDAESSGIPNPYDFSEPSYGMAHHPQNGVQSKAQLSQLFCGTAELNPKDVPPSYTALFFAASDSSGKDGGSSRPSTATKSQQSQSETKITNIQPIHLKVTSSSAKKERSKEEQVEKEEEMMKDYYGDDFLNREDSSTAPPVSLLSVESDDSSGAGNNEKETDKATGSGVIGDEEKKTNNLEHADDSLKQYLEKKVEKPPPYNPGYEAYRRF